MMMDGAAEAVAQGPKFDGSRRLVAAEAAVLGRVERLCSSRAWVLSVVILAVSCSLFVNFPRISFFWGDEQLVFVWKTVEWQAEHLLQPVPAPPIAHDAKRNFRLVQPVLLAATGEGWVFGLIVQIGMGLCAVALVAALAGASTRDRPTGALVGFGFAQILAGKVAFLELGGIGDGFGVFFLVAAMAAPRSWLVGMAAFLACYCDERAAVALGLVMLFHAAQPDGTLRFSPRAIAVALAVAAYGISRAVLGHVFGLATPAGPGTGLGLDTILHTAPGLHILIPLSLCGFWLAVVATVWFLIVRRRWVTTMVLALATLCVMGAAFMVEDTDRSLVYLVPLVVLPLRFAWYEIHEARRLYLAIAVLCLVLPSTALIGVYSAPGAPGRYKEGNLFPIEIVRAISKATTHDR